MAGLLSAAMIMSGTPVHAFDTDTVVQQEDAASGNTINTETAAVEEPSSEEDFTVEIDAADTADGNTTDDAEGSGEAIIIDESETGETNDLEDIYGGGSEGDSDKSEENTQESEDITEYAEENGPAEEAAVKTWSETHAGLFYNVYGGAGEVCFTKTEDPSNISDIILTARFNNDGSVLFTDSTETTYLLTSENSVYKKTYSTDEESPLDRIAGGNKRAYELSEEGGTDAAFYAEGMELLNADSLYLGRDGVVVPVIAEEFSNEMMSSKSEFDLLYGASYMNRPATSLRFGFDKTEEGTRVFMKAIPDEGDAILKHTQEVRTDDDSYDVREDDLLGNRVDDDTYDPVYEQISSEYTLYETNIYFNLQFWHEEKEEEDTEENKESEETENLEEQADESELPLEEEEKEEKIPTFDHEYEFDGNYDGQDFSSCRLLIASDSEDIFTWDTEILSSYNGIYLARFADEETAKNAFSYYYSRAEFVEADMQISTAADTEKGAEDREKDAEEIEDGQEASENSQAEGLEDASQNNAEDVEDKENSSDTDQAADKEENGEETAQTETETEQAETETDAISELNKLTEEIPESIAETQQNHTRIVLVDTGLPEGTENLISVLGDDGVDRNGHGTKMAEFIRSQDQDAEIVSVKAVNDDGVGNISDIYAAIEYAISADADIINLSVSGYMTEGSESIKSAVAEAKEAGIIVVGAAGNNNKDAKWFVPGGITDVIVAGACDEKGVKLPASNYGDTVDYNVKAASTSEAAAVLSGFISKNGIDAIKNVINKGLIFEAGYKGDDSAVQVPEEDKDKVTTAYPTPGDDWGTYTGAWGDVPSAIIVKSKTYIRYSSAKSTWKENALNRTGIITAQVQFRGYENAPTVSNVHNTGTVDEAVNQDCTLTDDANKPIRTVRQARLFCVDPMGYSFNAGVRKTNIMRITSRNIVRALYYGLSPKGENPSAQDRRSIVGGHNKAADIGGSTNAGYVLVHYALSYYFLANISHFGVGGRAGTKTFQDVNDLWNNTNQALRNDVMSYMTYVQSATVPKGVGAYIVYPAGSTKTLNGAQPYMFMIKNNQSRLRIRKTSARSWALNSAAKMVPENANTYTDQGAVFGIWSDAACTKKLFSLTTNANGYTDYVNLAYGTYYIRETSAPAGFYRNPDKVTAINVTADVDATEANRSFTATVANYPRTTAGLTIVKSSSNGTGGSLANAQFTVKYYAGYYTAAQLASATPTRQWVLKTGTDGKASLDAAHKVSGDDFFSTIDENNNNASHVGIPKGTVTIEETAAPTGFQKDPKFTVSYTGSGGSGTYSVNTKFIGYVLQDGQSNTAYSAYMAAPQNKQANHITNTVTVTDTPAYGGVVVDKADSAIKVSNNANKHLGKASLANAEIEIVNNNDYQVTVKGGTTKFAKGAVVCTIKTNAAGRAQTAQQYLQVGSYIAREKTAPTGYNKTGTLSRTFSVTANTFTNLNTATTTIQDDVIRGDFKFQKKSNNGQPLGGVLFQVKSNTTGEAHNIVTKSDGSYSSASSFNPHTTNTNGGTATSGLWFNKAADGTSYGTPNDSLGALPYDTYTLTELACSANQNYTLASPVQFTISKNTTVVDLGTIINTSKEQPRLETYAASRFNTTAPDYSDHGSKYIKAGSTAYDQSSFYNVPAENLNNGTLQTYNETKLVDQATGDVLATKGGVKTWIKKDNMYWCVSDGFTISDNMKGKTLVFYEYVYKNNNGAKGALIISHENRNDTAQMVYIPKLETTATDSVTGTHSASNAGIASGTITVNDNVVYENLEPGRQYTIKGTLMDKTTGQAATDKNGNVIEKTVTFTASSSGDGTVNVPFTFEVDNSFKGKEFVAYEDIAGVASHEDIEDEAQLITFPNPRIIRTLAVDKASNLHQAVSASTYTVSDTVEYSGLEIGKSYTLKGTLMDKTTGQQVSEDAVNTVTFTPQTSSGTIVVDIDANASDVDGRICVAYEELYETDDDTVISEHKDLTDADQTVFFPGMSTVAVNKTTGKHYIEAAPGQIIKDTVSYSGFESGNTPRYKIVGGVMDENGQDIASQMVNASGSNINGTAFTSETGSGTVEVFYKIDASSLTGRKVIIYENIYRTDSGSDVLIASHKDVNDANQTVFIPNIETDAVDKGTDTNIGMVNNNELNVVVDKVTYSGLVPGQQYKITGNLMKKGASPEEVSSTIIRASYTEEDQEQSGTDEPDEPDTSSISFTAEEVTFTPSNANGEMYISFQYNAEGLKGESIVVFEDLLYEDTPIVVHHDINDTRQTIYFPDGYTKAEGVNAHKNIIFPAADQYIDDTFYYENLIPGVEYSVQGRVMIKSDDGQSAIEAESFEMLDDLGNSIVEKVFTPESADGSIKIRFKVNAYEYAGKELVIFEEMSMGGSVILSHEDPTDMQQTVGVPEGRIKLQKNDTNTDQLVPGAIYGVFNAVNDQLVVEASPTGADGTVTVTGLGLGSYYFKEMTAPAGYKLDNTKYAFAINEQNIVADNNLLPMNVKDEHKKGHLVIRKTLSDAVPDVTKDFTFDVTLSKTGEDDITGRYAARKTTASGTQDVTVDFEDGSATITLKHNESIDIELPSDYTYTVRETPAMNYKVVTPASGQYTGTIEENVTKTAAFTNKLDVSTLKVKKTVTGKLGNRNKDFNFTITLKDSEDRPLSGTFEYEGSKTGRITLDSQGKAKFTLSHGQEITFKNIPISTKYTVTEDSYASDGYTTTSTNASGTIQAGGAEASFINDRDGNIPTGIDMKFPFVILLISAAGIAFILKRKKRV